MYYIKHTGLNTIVLSSGDGAIDDKNIFVGIDRCKLEKLAQWQYSSPNELILSPRRPISNISDSLNWFNDVYRFLLDIDIVPESLNSVYGLDSAAIGFLFNKTFGDGDLTNQKDLDITVYIAPPNNATSILVKSYVRIYHSLTLEAIEDTKRTNILIDSLRDVKNKLPHILAHTHICANDVDDFELSIMRHYIDKIFE